MKIVSIKNFSKKSFGIAKTHFKMLYFHAVRGADAGAKFITHAARFGRGKIFQNRAVRGAVDVSDLDTTRVAVSRDYHAVSA